MITARRWQLAASGGDVAESIERRRDAADVVAREARRGDLFEERLGEREITLRLGGIRHVAARKIDRSRIADLLPQVYCLAEERRRLGKASLPLRLQRHRGHRRGHAVDIAQLVVDGAGLAAERLGAQRIPLNVGEDRRRVQRTGARARRRRSGRHRQDASEGFAPFRQVVALLPEAEQRAGEPHRPLDIPGRDQGGHRDAKVVVLAIAGAEPRLTLRRVHVGILFLGQDQHVGCVRALRRRCLAAVAQPLPPVLAERLEHMEARVSVV